MCLVIMQQDDPARVFVQKWLRKGTELYSGRNTPSTELVQTMEQILKGVLRREQFELRRTARLVAMAIPLASLADDGQNGTAAGWNVSAAESHLHVARPAAGLMEVAHLHPGTSPAERSPVLPTLFMPGFPKSATSWLYQCLLASFSPSAVGCGRQASGWSAGACGRRFAVTALQSDARGRYSEKKELFYFGGVKPDIQFRYAPDLLNLHGPDPTAGPNLAHLPPLWPWEPQHAPARVLRRRLTSMCRQAPPSQACKLERAAQPHCGRGRYGGGGNCSDGYDRPPRCSNLGISPHISPPPSACMSVTQVRSAAALLESGHVRMRDASRRDARQLEARLPPARLEHPAPEQRMWPPRVRACCPSIAAVQRPIPLVPLGAELRTSGGPCECGRRGGGGGVLHALVAAVGAVGRAQRQRRRLHAQLHL